MGYFQASGPPADDANDSASTASAPIVPATTDNTVGISAIGSEPNTAEPGTPSLHLSFVSVHLPSVDANVSIRVNGRPLIRELRRHEPVGCWTLRLWRYDVVSSRSLSPRRDSLDCSARRCNDGDRSACRSRG